MGCICWRSGRRYDKDAACMARDAADSLSGILQTKFQTKLLVPTVDPQPDDDGTEVLTLQAKERRHKPTTTNQTTPLCGLQRYPTQARLARLQH